MNNLNVNNTRNGSIFLGVVLAVFLLSVSGWGVCFYSSTGQSPYEGNSNPYCKGDPSWGASFPLCSSTPACSGGVIQSSNYYYFNCWANHSGRNMCSNGSWGTAYAMYSDVFCRYKCSSQCEADSIVCQNSGGTWTNTGASTCDGKSCKLPVCKQADTQWLDSAKAACDALGGENNFAITEVGETCVHSGTCCTASDSIPVGNTCKWRCDSALTQCNGRTGSLFGAVLPDTSVSGQDTTFSYQCYYNCSHSPNPDSTVYLVEGNIVLSGPSDSIPDGIKSETFNSVRTTTGGVYVYDYLSPAASEYVDSIAAMKCVEHLWRCVINNKYVYWYDNQEVPAGCTNIVRVK